MLSSIFNLFFPKVCAACNSILLTSERVICTVCRHDLPLTNHHLNPQNEMFKKFYGKLDIEFASALLYFQKKGSVQELIHKLKYKGQQEIGATLGNWYAEDLKNLDALKKIDFIIPVPIHKKRLKTRGYNQVTTFCDALSKNLKIPVQELLLVRDKNTQSQTKKNRLNRGEIATEIFSVDGLENFKSKHFLLVDDVVTTGATLESCGRELMKIEGVKLSIVCIATTPRN